MRVATWSCTRDWPRDSHPRDLRDVLEADLRPQVVDPPRWTSLTITQPEP